MKQMAREMIKKTDRDGEVMWRQDEVMGGGGGREGGGWWGKTEKWEERRGGCPPTPGSKVKRPITAQAKQAVPA